MDDMMAQLRAEGFTERMIQLLSSKIEDVMQLTVEERSLMRERLSEILLQNEKKNINCTQVSSPSDDDTKEIQQRDQEGALYEAFGNAMSRILKKNNEHLLEEMDSRISQRIMKEMNYLFRERENLEEERYRKLDRTIRDFQVLRQQTAMEEERKRLRRYGFMRR